VKPSSFGNGTRLIPQRGRGRYIQHLGGSAWEQENLSASGRIGQAELFLTLEKMKHRTGTMGKDSISHGQQAVEKTIKLIEESIIAGSRNVDTLPLFRNLPFYRVFSETSSEKYNTAERQKQTGREEEKGMRCGKLGDAGRLGP